MYISPMEKNDLNTQEYFWKKEAAEEYLKDNSVFDVHLGVQAWRKILSKIDLRDLTSVADLGSN